MFSNLSTRSASSSCRFQAVAASVSRRYVRSMTLLCFATLVERPSILVSSTDKRLLMATYVPHAASTADITADAMGITSVDISSSITPHRLDRDPGSYGLEVDGDCMDRVCPPGMVAVVQPGVPANSGDVVVATIDGADSIMRRMTVINGDLILSPESHNPNHEIISF